MSILEKKMIKRFYVVTNKTTGKARLVRATSQSQAMHYVAATDFSVAIASPHIIVDLMSQGVAVESGGNHE